MNDDHSESTVAMCVPPCTYVCVCMHMCACACMCIDHSESTVAMCGPCSTCMCMHCIALDQLDHMYVRMHMYTHAHHIQVHALHMQVHALHWSRPAR